MISGAQQTSTGALAHNDTGQTVPRSGGFLRRLVILFLACLLILLDAFWVIRAERITGGPYFSTISLFANVLFILTGVTILNALVRKVAPRTALSQGELMLIYAMLAVGGAFAGQDMGSALVPLISHAATYSGPENGWADRFGQYLPKLWTISDKKALKSFYDGHSTLYTPEHLALWATPAIAWCFFIAILFWTMMCLNVLVRRGWQERERLPFPVVELPIQMTENSGALWKKPLFWVGFCLVAAIEVLNGLHSLYPALPEINLQHYEIQNQGIFTQWPYNAVGFTCYSFYPFAIGLGYLLPLDLIFSCWFFYLFWKAQLIISRAASWDTTPDFPFVREQAFGGYLAILVFMFWNGRQYFQEMFKRIFGEPSELDDTNEGLTYRQAMGGALVGFTILAVFFVWAGMRPSTAALAFLIYFALALAVARLRAELGPPVHDLHFSGPDHMLPRMFGTTALGAQDLTLLSFFYWFNRAYRAHPMPHGVEGLKAASDTDVTQKGMFWALILAGVFSGIAVFWAYLHQAYILGAASQMQWGRGFGDETYNRLNGWLQTPQPPNLQANIAALGGFVFCSLLMIARIRFAGFPFHPIGYAISGSWSMNLVWMPLFFAWVIKGLLLRYGGVRLYRQALPFFLGLILGQFLVGPFWHLIGLLLDTRPYSFWGG